MSESVTVKAVLLKDKFYDFIVMINNNVVNITGDLSQCHRTLNHHHFQKTSIYDLMNISTISYSN